MAMSKHLLVPYLSGGVSKLESVRAVHVMSQPMLD